MSTRRRTVRVCASSLAAVPVRGEILARMNRIRGVIARAEASADITIADSARLELLVLGELLGSLARALEAHRDLHPFESETLVEIEAIAAALGGVLEPPPISRAPAEVTVEAAEDDEVRHGLEEPDEDD